MRPARPTALRHSSPRYPYLRYASLRASARRLIGWEEDDLDGVSAELPDPVEPEEDDVPRPAASGPGPRIRLGDLLAA